jgi:alpha-ketoglutarate-dependent taurine dioxygenase
LEASHPVLEQRADGKGVFVNLNNGVRASQAALSIADPDTMRAHYAAVATFRANLRSELYQHVAEPGDVWVFDNRRVLHGR